MTYELSLIKRQKLNGLGEHYGVQFGAEVIDFHDTYKVTTMQDFSKNNKYKVTEEAKALVSINEAQERFKDLNNYQYDLFTKNCEHWARRMVEGQYLSKQINGLVLVGLIAGIVFVATRKTA